MVSDEELIDEIQRLASNGEPPTQREFTQDGRWSHKTVDRHFGSWNNAVRAAGFTVNKVGKYSEKRKILQAIQEHSDRNQGPTNSEFEEDADIGLHTAIRRFGSWWAAVVQAGLVPQRRFPLTASQFCEFHEAAISRDTPEESLTGLFLLFTGLPAELISEVSRSWFDYLSDDRYDTTLTVPRSHLRSDSTGEWTFKLPATYTIDGAVRNTQLPGLAEWFFTQSPYSGQTLCEKNAVERLTRRIARDAEISRRSINLIQVGEYPDVTPGDLRASAGVQMARNGAPARRIERHLGIEHTGWKADVEDFFLWIYVHEGITHNQYDPPDIVLDPVDPDSSPE